MESAPRACSACGREGLHRVGSVPGFVEGTEFPVYECTLCKSQSVRPLSVPAGIYDAIYRAGAGFAGYARYHRYAKVVASLRHPLRYLAYTENVYWAVADALAQRKGGQALRILEVGSGLGYLTASLRKEGHEAWGVDLSEEAAAAARRRYGPWYANGDRLADAIVRLETAPGFDLVVGLELIEHVPDPLALIREMRDCLRPGGEILLSTPNRSNHRDGALWCSSLPPVHLHWFSEAGLSLMGERAGLVSELTDFTRFNRMRDRPRRPAPPQQIRHIPKLSATLDPLVTKPVQGVSHLDRIHDLPFSRTLLATASKMAKARDRLLSSTKGSARHHAPASFDTRSTAIAVRYRFQTSA